MSKEKQIEEMCEILRQNAESCKTCSWHKEGLCIDNCELSEDNQTVCEILYNAGYRKQSEGEGLVLTFDGATGYFPKEFIVEAIRAYSKQKKGSWKIIKPSRENGKPSYICSVCGALYHEDVREWKGCPKCLSEMKGGAK